MGVGMGGWRKGKGSKEKPKAILMDQEDSNTLMHDQTQKFRALN